MLHFVVMILLAAGSPDLLTAIRNGDHAQVRKCRKLAAARLPHGRVANFSGIAGRIWQQPNAPVLAHVVEPALPSFWGPVRCAAVNEQRERAFIH